MLDPATRVSYAGTDPQLRDLFSRGWLAFPTFQAMRAYIQGPLTRQYQNTTPTSRPTRPVPGAERAVVPVEQLTDLEAVRRDVRASMQSISLDGNELTRLLKRKVRGQDEALGTIGGTVSRFLAKPNPERPASLALIGGTGTGKTLTANELARVLEPYGFSLLPIDFSELQGSESRTALSGAPPGFVGYEDGALLADSLRANPRTLLLLDELSKGHPSLRTQVMNMLETGELSSHSGRSREREGSERCSAGHRVDCRRAIVVMTTNLAADEIGREVERRGSCSPREVNEICRRRLEAAGLRDDFLGRVGQFVLYRPLTTDIQAEIALLQVVEVAEEFGLHVVSVEPGVVTELLAGVPAMSFGARPLRFVVDELLGEAFKEVARTEPGSEVSVCGPPFECRPQGRLRIVDDRAGRDEQSERGV
jgi:ATP-dependent Clp protease ATP-binding subunit ClpC